MEERPKINLQQFRSTRKNKRFLVRFTIYSIVLTILAVVLTRKLEQGKKKNEPIREIRNVTIETK